MDSKTRFGALEMMCHQRAIVAREEMEYWLAEAEEWRQLKKSSDRFLEGMPTQPDWRKEANNR
jgi:hypothetical protein